MPRKVIATREPDTPKQEKESPSVAAQDDKRKRKGKERPDPTQAELMRMTLRACLIARDATYNVQDLLTNSSRMAFLAIRDCEKELDQIGRRIDEQLPGAITRVNERKARQLRASLKCLTDLERIGDLVT